MEACGKASFPSPKCRVCNRLLRLSITVGRGCRWLRVTRRLASSASRSRRSGRRSPPAVSSDRNASRRLVDRAAGGHREPQRCLDDDRREARRLNPRPQSASALGCSLLPFRHDRVSTPTASNTVADSWSGSADLDGEVSPDLGITAIASTPTTALGDAVRRSLLPAGHPIAD
jgi:hypothetical protein